MPSRGSKGHECRVSRRFDGFDEEDVGTGELGVIDDGFDDLLRTQRGRKQLFVLDSGFEDLGTGRRGVIKDGFDEVRTGGLELGTTFFFLLTRA